ncbi:MAG: cobalamin biosynthesis protein [Candidatus Methanoperedenaceae archaeon]|nr:MAG: cobalamin biosynthesis protein [Candidatus Methanoperedenaceae archaeon]
MMEFWSKVLLLAVLLDIVFGEMPARFHPVVWMGKLISLFMGAAPCRHRKLYGLCMVIFCVGITVLLASLLIGPGILGLVITAYFLKSSFSIRMLLISAIGIQKDLDAGMIEKVRRDLKIFVGRDTSELNSHQSASAVIESLAESFVDGVLSPLFYFLLFGLPGALAYRMINTLDSMVGYKKEPFLELGYAAAKLDDLVNWIPARISIMFLFIASIFSGRPFDSLRTCIRDHNKTASPNSGWAMAAVSGAMNVRLEKAGYHVLGTKYPPPETSQIRKTVFMISYSSLLVIGVIFFIGKIPLVPF